MNKSPKIITTILIVLFFLPSFAQELKTKKVATDIYLEIFTIDKKNKLKNGEYFKIDTKSRDTLISGTFRDDIKSGVWKYNIRGTKAWITYDYDKKLLIPTPDQIIKIDSFVIRKGDAFEFEKVDSPPLYIGYKNEVQNILVMNFRPPQQIFQEGLSVTSVASFVVDKNGKMKGFQIVKMSSSDVSAAAFAAFKKIDGDWSPAIFNGQPVDSQVFIIFDIMLNGASSTIPKIPNAIRVRLQYEGIKRAPVEIGRSTSGSGYGRSANHR
ncbi:MAG: energy transducer TonB [Bacteroidia bacterium]|nr:energy transducer TonB [Bacteroidia bacterium]